MTTIPPIYITGKTLTVVLLREEEGYSAAVRELPGCYSQGETMEEVENNIREAISLYFDIEFMEADNEEAFLDEV